jgi:serine/threonine protein kinase
LKPENIGFDIRNDVKIFDFGLAKELVMAQEKYADGTLKLTEMSTLLLPYVLLYIMFADYNHHEGYIYIYIFRSSAAVSFSR